MGGEEGEGRAETVGYTGQKRREKRKAGTSGRNIVGSESMLFVTSLLSVGLNSNLHC